MQRESLIPLFDALIDSTQEQRRELERDIEALLRVRKMFTAFEQPRKELFSNTAAEGTRMIVAPINPTVPVLVEPEEIAAMIPKQAASNERLCAFAKCGKPFIPTYPTQLYHDKKCSKLQWVYKNLDRARQRARDNYKSKKETEKIHDDTSRINSEPGHGDGPQAATGKGRSYETIGERIERIAGEIRDQPAGDREAEASGETSTAEPQPEDRGSSGSTSQDGDQVRTNERIEKEPVTLAPVPAVAPTPAKQTQPKPVKGRPANTHAKYRCAGCHRSFVAACTVPPPTLCRQTYCEVERRIAAEQKAHGTRKQTTHQQFKNSGSSF